MVIIQAILNGFGTNDILDDLHATILKGSSLCFVFLATLMTG